MSAIRAERALSHEEQLLIEKNYSTIRDRVLAMTNGQGGKVEMQVQARDSNRIVTGSVRNEMSFDPSTQISSYSFRFSSLAGTSSDETLTYLFTTSSVRKGGVTQVDLYTSIRPSSVVYYSDETIEDAIPDSIIVPTLRLELGELEYLSQIISDPIKNDNLRSKLVRLPAPARHPQYQNKRPKS